MKKFTSLTAAREPDRGAFLWEGKCFEEQGDLRRPWGLQRAVARITANETVRQIRDHAVQFRLACLNQEAGKDSSLVVNEATQWLDAAKDRKNSAIGLGIRWQRAVAAERMAAGKDADPENHEALAEDCRRRRARK